MAQGAPCGRPARKTVHQAQYTLHRVDTTAGHREAGSIARARAEDHEIHVGGLRDVIRGLRPEARSGQPMRSQPVGRDMHG